MLNIIFAQKKNVQHFGCGAIGFHVNFAQWHLHTSSVPAFPSEPISVARRLAQTRRIAFDNGDGYFTLNIISNSIKFVFYIFRVVGQAAENRDGKVWCITSCVHVSVLETSFGSESGGNVKQETCSWEIARKREEKIPCRVLPYYLNQHKICQNIKFETFFLSSSLFLFFPAVVPSYFFASSYSACLPHGVMLILPNEYSSAY